jgi:hypothetical protein
MSMRKFAKSVSEDLEIIDAMVEKITDAIILENSLETLRDDEKFRVIFNKLDAITTELYEYMLDTSAALKDYEKPSMRKEDVLDIVEERY